MPLILSAPGLQPAVVPSQVSLVDLMPTLLELAGAPLDGLDGRSLLPLARGTEEGDRPALIVGTDSGAVSQLAVRHAAVEAPPRRSPARRRPTASISTRASSRAGPRTARRAPRAARRRAGGRLARALSADDEALVERRLADLGYL